MEKRPPLKQYFFKEKGKRSKADNLKMIFVIAAVLLLLCMTCFPAIYNLFDAQDKNDIADEYKTTDIIKSVIDDSSDSKDPRK